MVSVSVVVTAFNASKYLGSALDSLRNQEFEDFEVVLVLDGPDEAAAAIARERAVADERIRVIQMPRIGRGAALNVGVHASKGEFLAILDADDVSLPSRLSTQIRVIQNANPEVAVVGSLARKFTDETPLVDDSVPGELRLFDATDEVRRRMPFAHSTVIMRTAAVRESGTYDVGRTSQFDFDLMIRLAANGWGLLRIERELVGIREHPERYFASSSRIRYRVSGIVLLSSALNRIPGPALDWAYIPARMLAIFLPQRLISSMGRMHPRGFRHRPVATLRVAESTEYQTPAGSVQT